MTIYNLTKTGARTSSLTPSDTVGREWVVTFNKTRPYPGNPKILNSSRYALAATVSNIS